MIGSSIRKKKLNRKQKREIYKDVRQNIERLLTYFINKRRACGAARTIGEHTIDLRVEVFVKDNGILLDLLEHVKAMKGVRDVIWTEVVQSIGTKNPLNLVTF